jgi:hypothetical protein
LWRADRHDGAVEPCDVASTASRSPDGGHETQLGVENGDASADAGGGIDAHVESLVEEHGLLSQRRARTRRQTPQAADL